MSVKTEGVRNAEFLISEANGTRSRLAVTVHVPAGETYLAGLVLGKVTSGGKYVARLTGAGDGSSTAKGILYEHADNADGVAAVDFERTIINADAEVQGETMDANGGVEATVLTELLALGIKVLGDLSGVAT